MKTMKVVVSIMLLVTLFLSACAPAAQPTKAAEEPAKQAEPTKAPEEAKPAEPTKAPEEPAVEEPAAAPDKVVLWAPGSSGTVKDWNTNPIMMEVEKATNTDIEIQFIDWGAYNDQLQAAAASGEFPDIAATVDHNAKTMLRTWIDAGIVAPFEGDVAAAAPNVLAQYEKNPTLSEIKFDGKIYMQPVYWGVGNEPNMGLIHVRKDLLDKYGMEAPDTWDQYVEFLKKCSAEEKISGLVFTAKGGFPSTALNANLGAYGVPMRGWVQKADGNYEYWAVQPEVATALKQWRALIADGLVDPAVWEMDSDTARTAYVSGNACSYNFNGGGHVGRIQNDMTLVNPEFQEWMLPALDFGTGKRGYTQEDMFWAGTLLGAGENNNPVAAARVVNYLISPEGEKLTAIGVEGKHFKMNGDKVEWLPARFEDGFPTEALNAGAHPLASGIVSWQPSEWQEFTLLYGKDQAYEDWYKSMNANRVQYQTPSFGANVTSPKWDAFQATGSDLIARMLTDTTKAASDDEVQTIFDQFVSDWMSMGGQDASAEMNETIKEFYK